MDDKTKCAWLANRFKDGRERIDQALAAGRDVPTWENFWLDLLREYESTCADIALNTSPTDHAADPAQPPIEPP